MDGETVTPKTRADFSRGQSGCCEQSRAVAVSRPKLAIQWHEGNGEDSAGMPHHFAIWRISSIVGCIDTFERLFSCAGRYCLSL